MNWQDEGYLLSKSNYSENSIIIEAFTLNHGKTSGIVYGGSSRAKKKIFQIGNKISLNWKAKGENKIGYFTIELIKAISPLFFDNKKKTICIMSASSILKLSLPEEQINKKIYESFEKLLTYLNQDDWIKLYILWELTLIKELGFEYSFLKDKNLLDQSFVEVNGNHLKIPKILTNYKLKNFTRDDIKEALSFNKNLLIENLIEPNRLRFPLSRNILEKYFN